MRQIDELSEDMVVVKNGYGVTVARPSCEATDEELLSRIRYSDDYDAFTILFKRYYAYLCDQSYSIIRCQQKAEEVVSDLFFKLWINRKTINTVSKVKYYLRRWAHNRTIDHLRKASRELNFSEVQLPEFTSNYPDPESYTIGEECRKGIQEAIAKLPPKSQMVFLMSREEGKKYREIADELGLSIKTIETHMRRALIFLRKEIYGT